MNIIKYQDSEFTAYATSSDLNYAEGEQVYILIPGNDWDRNRLTMTFVYDDIYYDVIADGYTKEELISFVETLK